MKTILFTAALLAAQVASAQADRAYQYGLDIVQINNKPYVLWSEHSSISNFHDIFMGEIDLATNSLLSSEKIVNNFFSQAPVSAAVNANKKLFVTSTDTQVGVNQYYSFYDVSAGRTTIKNWSQLLADNFGGRTVAVGNNFFTVSSTNLIVGGGYNGADAGKNLVLSIVDTNGNLINAKPVTNNGVNSKILEDSPKVASDGSMTLVIYQRYVDKTKLYGGQVYGVFINSKGQVGCPFLIATNTRYDSYSVTYNPTIKRFLVAGSAANSKGFVRMLDSAGKFYTTLTNLPEIVREAQIISSGNKIAYVGYQNVVAFLKATDKKLAYVGAVQAQANWSEAGTDGIFKPDGSLLIMTMNGSEGVTMVPFAVPTALSTLLAAP